MTGREQYENELKYVGNMKTNSKIFEKVNEERTALIASQQRCAGNVEKQKFAGIVGNPQIVA